MTNEPESESASWRKLLIEGHEPMRMSHLMFRFVPTGPRCKMCHSPFEGVGGKFFGMLGFRRSRKNPTLCSKCCDALPPGGAKVDVAVLFADVRGSTSLGEELSPDAFAARLNQFYRVATETLIAHDAIIDKLIGDAVMALFLPGIAGPQYRKRAPHAALALIKALGYRPGSEPLIPAGAAVHAGEAYVGNVGHEGIVDFTALGDVVNTAARLAALAPSGEVILSEALHDDIAAEYPRAERRLLDIRGKQEQVAAYVIRGES